MTRYLVVEEQKFGFKIRRKSVDTAANRQRLRRSSPHGIMPKFRIEEGRAPTDRASGLRTSGKSYLINNPDSGVNVDGEVTRSIYLDKSRPQISSQSHRFANTQQFNLEHSNPDSGNQNNLKKHIPQNTQSQIHATKIGNSLPVLSRTQPDISKDLRVGPYRDEPMTQEKIDSFKDKAEPIKSRQYQDQPLTYQKLLRIEQGEVPRDLSNIVSIETTKKMLPVRAWERGRVPSEVKTNPNSSSKLNVRIIFYKKRF